MNQLIKNIYLAFVVLMVVVFLILNFNYYEAEKLINQEVKQTATASTEVFEAKMSHWVESARQVIYDTYQVVELEQSSNDKIKTYLEGQVERYSQFTSIYYGKVDGTLIISNDWQPEEGFDLSERPWYKDAVAKGDFVMTAPFDDAYTGEQIVSLSVPVYNADGSLAGVISGDIKTDTIVESIASFTHVTGGYAIVTDEDNQTAFRLSDVKEEYEAKLLGSRQEASLGINDAMPVLGQEGFIQFSEIQHTPWSLLAFVPTDAYSNATGQLRWILNLLMGVLMMACLLVYHFQKKQVTLPLLELENQIGAIDVERDSTYRIDLHTSRFLSNLQNKINALLDKVFQYILEIENDKEELHALNEELEASFGQLMATEQEVTRQKLYFESLFKNSPEAVAMFDQEHRIVDINKAFEEMFKYTLPEIRGRDLDEVIAHQLLQKEANIKTKELFEGGEVKFEAIRYDKFDNPIHMAVTGVRMTYEGYTVGGYGIYSDITKRIEREKHLEFVGTHDYLTKLYNRYYFETYLDSIDDITNLPVCVIMIDVNGLKLINDAFGNATGDELLIKTASILVDVVNKHCKEKCIIARIGGDEFAIVKINCQSEGISDFVRLIIEECSKVRIGELELSVSTGWSERKQIGESIQSVLKTAEDNLLRHKLTENPSIRGKTIDTIMNTLHEKSPREEEHSKRVSELCYQIGLQMKLTDRELNEIKTMGLLHDVGKIAISDKILNKEGKLTDQEYEEIKRHPEIGYRILSSVNELSEMANYVLAHHEKWDGSGYPKGLKEAEIPLLARIIAVADAFDAMTSNRSYRQALTYQAALEEIQRFSGTQFDPDIVGLFTQYIESINQKH